MGTGWRLGLLALLAGGLGSGALAMDRALSAGAFDARTLGKTLYFDLDGQPYGAEQYMPNRRVRWQNAAGQCLEGSWYEESGDICFVYEGGSDGPQCWRVFDRDGTIFAQLRGRATEDAIAASSQDTRPLNCPGPDLGV